MEQEKTNGESGMTTAEAREATLQEIGLMPEAPLASQLDPLDTELFRPAIKQLENATQNYEALKQQIAQAQHQQSEAVGAVKYLFNYFRTKYGLKDGDNIQEDGVIIRAE